MAGNYPDAPSWRMAWDRDGSTGFILTGSGAVTEMTTGEKVSANNETSSFFDAVNAGNGGCVGVVFPELRDIDGYWVNLGTTSGGNQTIVIEVSADTTNGLDGTWTQIGTYFAVWNTDVPPKPNFRTAIASTTQLSKRGIRARWPTGSNGSPDVINFHLYGEPIPGANPNRLELWHPTLDEKLPPAFFDWGNVPRSSSADRQFRVKNLSSTQTALAPRCAMEVLTDGTPSVPAQHTLSHNGGSFLAQVNIGDLAPGAISTPVTIRRVTPSNAQLGLWAFRVFAESTVWS